MASPSRRRGLLSGPGKTRNRRRNPLWRFRRALFLLSLFGIGVMIGAVAILSQEELPELRELDAFAQTSYLCTAEVPTGCGPDNATAQFTAGEDRVLVEFEQIPDVVIEAIIATEDADFFDHKGVDPYGIGRALVRDIQARELAQGGSTITQQLVKIELGTPDRNLVNKLEEATLAIKLERELSKEEILTRYLNIIYFGRGAYGLQSAAQNYFDKNVDELDLADAALLAGLIRAPSTADPANAPEEATRRRLVTLTRMVDEGMITIDEAQEAANRDWSTLIESRNRQGLGAVKNAAFGSEYFVEAVRQQVTALDLPGLPDDATYTSGLRIYTTLDPQLQIAAFQTVSERDFTGGSEAAASIVAVDERGFVRAMVGGTDFSTSQVNLALGRDGGGSGRQPGSSFKPFALAEAIEQGISARSLYSAPFSITIPEANDGSDWNVSGGGSNEGYRDLVDALRISSNVVYAQLMVDLKPQSVVGMAEKLGVQTPLQPVNALVLGSGEVSVLDMAASYSTLMNQGVRYDPILIERIELDGQVICWYPVNGECADAEGRQGAIAIDASIANQVTFAMEGVVNAGTGGAAQFGRPAAGKTGTTQDARDAWFVGYTCDLTAAVWMGFVGAPGEPVQTMQNYRGLDEVHGGDFPAEMWSAFMARAAALPGVLGECNQLPQPAEFPGIQLNPELSTTTTLALCPQPPPTAPAAAPAAEGEQGAEGDEAAPTTTAPPPTTALPTSIDPETGLSVFLDPATGAPCRQPEPGELTPVPTTVAPDPNADPAATVLIDEEGDSQPASTTTPTTAASTTEAPATTAQPGNGNGNGEDGDGAGG